MIEKPLHERLRELLPSARAESCQVVATFLDIRGFSTFSARGDSFDSALYLRSAFTTILSSHFDDSIFFKLTGDGLLLIHELPSSGQGVPEIVSSILSRSVSLVGAFGQITADDYMISFPVPQKLGVGIARGSACRLVSDGGVLDYTGRCLNRAARLMDKARPSGVVFADSHAKHLMAPEVAMLFRSDEVCIRGISEEEPIPIVISADVEITQSDREPIPGASNRWGEPQTMSVAEVRESSGHGFYLRRPPLSDEQVGVHVEYPLFDKSGKPKDSVSYLDVCGDYLQQPNGPLVTIDFKRVKERIKRLPETTTGKILGFTHTKTTYVTFTPFCAPIDDE
jgi:class 3 adenylate cyclase